MSRVIFPPCSAMFMTNNEDRFTILQLTCNILACSGRSSSHISHVFADEIWNTDLLHQKFTAMVECEISTNACQLSWTYTRTYSHESHGFNNNMSVHKSDWQLHDSGGPYTKSLVWYTGHFLHPLNTSGSYVGRNLIFPHNSHLAVNFVSVSQVVWLPSASVLFWYVWYVS